VAIFCVYLHQSVLLSFFSVLVKNLQEVVVVVLMSFMPLECQCHSRALKEMQSTSSKHWPALIVTATLPTTGLLFLVETATGSAVLMGNPLHCTDLDLYF